ncbi:hypothetical protein PENARI_c097G07189 [Penicillium arizonense]|uniref:Uncharacterized protein n=1 Tax=Penicillium arizonense TaxID=1835702 RepID=A0A1F5L0Z1_PENAI|nr:hypothetical protein PENARI_c097G07189 [Penicillium arizonense]OGE46865.1 hypothetical protein PENARI_c097G07189 [Penicillium arizonense]
MTAAGVTATGTCALVMATLCQHYLDAPKDLTPTEKYLIATQS